MRATNERRLGIFVFLLGKSNCDVDGYTGRFMRIEGFFLSIVHPGFECQGY